MFAGLDLPHEYYSYQGTIVYNPHEFYGFMLVIVL